jgi:hypothetical protein
LTAFGSRTCWKNSPGAARYDDEGLGIARLVVVAERVADDL